VVGKQFFESTKNVIETAGKSLQRFQTSSGAYYTRDQSLPLDTEALKDAEVVYITDRIITMGHPAMQSNTDGDITSQRKLAAVGHLLQKRHAGKYMVWNLSEVEYDSSVLEDQVLLHYFPGSPSPPLGLLLKLIFSMESWLKADKENVAVLHCLTGKGRTSTVLACFLCWTGETGFTRDPMAALEYIALCKRSDNVDRLTIPSQRRYIGYFSNMLDGVRPHQPPLILRRIIMSEAPKVRKKKKIFFLRFIFIFFFQLVCLVVKLNCFCFLDTDYSTNVIHRLVIVFVILLRDHPMFQKIMQKIHSLNNRQMPHHKQS